MSHAHHASEAVVHKPHVLHLRQYLGVWIGLLVLTVVTVYVSYFDFGAMNVIVAMVVATAKASLVVLFFMHLKYDERFNVLVFISSIAFLAVFFIFTLADTTRRGEVDALERGTIEALPRLPGAEGHGAAPAGGGAGPGHEAAPADSGHDAAAPAGDGNATPPDGAPAGETPAAEPAPGASSGGGH